VKLLRVLQEGEIRPLGANKIVKVDMRLVTASNRDLEKLVGEGKFREDLFFRINGLAITLPPLRERKDDIPLLVDYLSQKIAKKFNLKPSEMTGDALQILVRYDWPGNIRELERVIRNALLFAKGNPITPEILATNANLFKTKLEVPSLSPARRNTGAEEKSSERQMILEALSRHQLSKEAVAEEMEISLRTLYSRLDQLGIPKKKRVLAKYLGMK
jgi:transcriptional regulator with PAS, ATPase and Fis domain